MVQAGGWFCKEALWMAVYGAAFCAAPVVKQVVPPAAAAAAAAAAGSERRQQQQEQRQQQRKEKRRRHHEKARQQQRQQRQQRYQQARDAVAELPADLAAAVPDVSSMKVAQLRGFLQEVRRKQRLVLYLCYFLLL
jgi:ribulose kinase